MGLLFNLARMTTATVGNGASLTLGAAVPGFLTFAQAGVADGQAVSYGIADGNNSEVGQGTVTGTTLTRNVLASTNGNARIALSGSAQVYVTALAEDINAKVAKAGDTMTGALHITDATASSSPTTGALTVAGGLGVSGNLNVNGTITGNVNLNVNSSGPALYLNSTDANTPIIFSSKINKTRWGIMLGDTAVESGGNAGSGFGILRYDDAGAYLGNPLYITRSDGRVSFASTTASSSPSTGALTVGGGVGVGADVRAAGGVYSGGTLLTCFGMQYLKHGKVDLAQWDAVSPTGKHALARRFVDMLEDFDPRDPGQYVTRMLRDEALPGMPTAAEWKPGQQSLDDMQNRLWLAVEILATAFAGAVLRIEALEQGGK